MGKLITAIKNKQPKTYKKELLKKKAELLLAIGTNFNTLAGSGTTSEEDLITVSHEQVVGLGMNRMFYDQLREVESAIRRLELRQYGTCLACGASISTIRLQAVPWARYCVDCQDKTTAEDEHALITSAMRGDRLPVSEPSHLE